MQGQWLRGRWVRGRRVRRPSPRVLGVALCSVTLVVTAVALSQADPGSEKAVAVAMLSGGDAAPLPGADMALPAPTAAAETAPESPPPAEPSTTTTAAKSSAARATAPAKPQPKPCPTNGAPERPCGPPCPHPAEGNGPAKCPPPPAPAPPPPPPPPPTCRQYDIQTGDSRPCPPPCSTADAAGNTSSCPQPCPALATADGQPVPCPPPPQPCPQPHDEDGIHPPVSSCPPPPCAYPTEPDGGIGNSQPQILIYCPPPCERDASCPQPCDDAPPSAAGGTTGAEPVLPSDPCPPPPPPPCPSAAPTDQRCTPPCSYEPAAGGPAAGGAFAPCASGVAGRVTAGPTCPVERPDEPCADKPVEATLRLLRKDGSVAATGKSYADGSFRMIVAPGSYRLVGDWPTRTGGCGQVEVTVEYGRFTFAELSCDTGIR